jgi:hypothetical protein
MNTLNYVGNHILYIWVFMILMAPIIIAAVVLRLLFNLFDLAGGIQLGLTLDVFLAFLWIAMACIVGHRAARNRVVKGMGYLEARERAWLDTRAELAYIPLIGRLFRKYPEDETGG